LGRLLGQQAPAPRRAKSTATRTGLSSRITSRRRLATTRNQKHFS
jgi:hypothetical protein